MSCSNRLNSVTRSARRPISRKFGITRGIAGCTVRTCAIEKFLSLSDWRRNSSGKRSANLLNDDDAIFIRMHLRAVRRKTERPTRALLAALPPKENCIFLNSWYATLLFSASGIITQANGAVMEEIVRSRKCLLMKGHWSQVLVHLPEKQQARLQSWRRTKPAGA